MKKFLFGIFILILTVQILSASVEYYELNNMYHKLKNVSELASGSATNYIDMDSFSHGVTIYNHAEGNKAIEDVIKTNLILNDSMNFASPETLNRFNEQVEYISYFFDENNIMTVYRNGTFQRAESIIYPYSFTDDIKGYIKTISHPTACVTIDVGHYNSSTGLFNNNLIVRSAAYEIRGE